LNEAIERSKKTKKPKKEKYMKRLVPLDPNVLCKRVEIQSEVSSGIIIPGQENKRGFVRKVVEVCPMAEQRHVAVGDIVVTRTPIFQELPTLLSDGDQIPFSQKENVELVDLGQIIAVYKDVETAD
jgi:co-chaperonin GroES (HSP10)